MHIDRVATVSFVVNDHYREIFCFLHISPHELCFSLVKVPLLWMDLRPMVFGLHNQLVELLPLLLVVGNDFGKAVTFSAPFQQSNKIIYKTNLVHLVYT